MATIERFYIEKLSNISADEKTGIVKITFGVDDPKGEEVVQIIVSAGNFRDIFGKIGETMQKTFGGGGGGGGPRPGGGPKRPGGPPNPNMNYKDLTRD